MARIITIARKMGSGGKTIGKMLSQELGYKYYDKELIKLASDESGINERFFELVDEKIKNPGFFRRKGVYKGALLDPDHPDFTSDGNLFNYQAEIIRQLADKEPAIIVGRCADYILKDRDDVIKVFIYSDEETAMKKSTCLIYLLFICSLFCFNSCGMDVVYYLSAPVTAYNVHAITSANNLLAAMLDNHIQQGNSLNIDTRQIVWKRCLDMNDRVLRNVVVGMGNKMDGFVREDHFVITVASEIMAVLCLADDMEDLKRRLDRMVVAYNYAGEPVTAGQIKATGAMAALLKDAIKPNLIQTLEHTPAIVHGGPFANIAHGCNSVRATKAAMKMADYVVTEAGFGADLGAEKFFDIKCVQAGLKPDAVVLVATIRALKYNGGVAKKDLNTENLDALKKGIVNLEKHIENLQKYGVPVVVTLNAFVTDTEAEIDYVKSFCNERNCDFALSEVWEKGGEGGIELANAVLQTLETKESHFKLLYDDSASLKEKIGIIYMKLRTFSRNNAVRIHNNKAFSCLTENFRETDNGKNS